MKARELITKLLDAPNMDAVVLIEVSDNGKQKLMELSNAICMTKGYILLITKQGDKDEN